MSFWTSFEKRAIFKMTHAVDPRSIQRLENIFANAATKLEGVANAGIADAITKAESSAKSTISHTMKEIEGLDKTISLKHQVAVDPAAIDRLEGMLANTMADLDTVMGKNIKRFEEAKKFKARDLILPIFAGGVSIAGGLGIGARIARQAPIPFVPKIEEPDS